MGETRSALGVICSSYDGFFEAEKKIADYMMEHKAEVVDMTVGELAKASGTSDATVSRFCRRCGFKGFHSLKLEHARMVQLAAVGNTIPVALDGAFKLNQLGIAAVAGDIWESQTAYTFNLGPEDVILIISNSGSSKRLMTLAQGAKENGCTVILITNNSSSPLAAISDYRIVTATREKLLTEEFWFSRVTATAVVEILYLLLMAGKTDAVDHIRRHENAISPDKK